MRPIRILRESLAMARTQPVPSLIAIIMIAGMCAAVLLTQGRTVGIQQAVVNTLDDAGTRTIIVRADAGAGLDDSVLARLHRLSSVATAVGFGDPVDATNSYLPGGTRVAAHTFYSLSPAQLGIQGTDSVDNAIASPEALEELGMAEPSGSISTVDGLEYPVTAQLDVPDHLAFMEPLIVIPRESSPDESQQGEPLTVLVVVANQASEVPQLTAVLRSVLGVSDPESVSIELSGDLIELRELVDSQLASSGRSLTLLIFTVTAVLVTATLTALIMLRRRDYGRRRALGASQRLICALVLTQTSTIAIVGSAAGAILAFAVLAASGVPQPPWQYSLAVASLATAVGSVSAVTPAVVAARRDPARELRVP